jgi:hypothetical protein
MEIPLKNRNMRKAMKSADIINTLEMAGYELIADGYDLVVLITNTKPIKYEVRFRNINASQIIIWAYGLTRYEALQKVWKEFSRANN